MSEPCKQWRKPSGDVVMFSLFLLDHELDLGMGNISYNPTETPMIWWAV
jgi:hypothetical protein